MTENIQKVCLVAGNLGKLSPKNEFKRGLGASIAQVMLDRDYLVVVTDLDESVLPLCVASLSGKVHARACDFLADRENVKSSIETDRGPKTQVTWTVNPIKEMVDSIISEFGRIDVVVSNFDYFKHNKIEKSSEEFFDEMKMYNAVPTFRLMSGIREALATQKKEKKFDAQVILITNIAGKAGISLSSIYSAMKGGDIGLTKCLAREFSRFATVNAVCYGLFSHKKMQGPMDRFKKGFMATSTEASKLNLTFDHVTPVVSFLASEGARAMNGQVLNVDGGLWLKLES